MKGWVSSAFATRSSLMFCTKASVARVDRCDKAEWVGIRGRGVELRIRAFRER